MMRVWREGATMPSDFQPMPIELDSPQWRQAVDLKRERAFAMLEQEGLAREEIEQRYGAYQQEQGVSFHDQKLREEITGGQLLGWWEADKLTAYASVCEAELLGDESRSVFNVLDVCLGVEATPRQCEAVVSSLLAKAQAASVQMYCNPVLYGAVGQAGGISVKQWFQWPCVQVG